MAVCYSVRPISVDYGKSIDFINEKLLLKRINYSPTIEFDLEAKCPVIINQDEVLNPTLILDIDESSAVAISCEVNLLETGLKWTTKQCFGYTSKGIRCKNRRSSKERHAWCHRHSFQQSYYCKTAMTYSRQSFIPDWWI
eukprot:gene18016-23655_t